MPTQSTIDDGSIGSVIRRFGSLLAIIAVVFLSVLAFGEDFSGRVVRVIDGDSIVVLRNGKAEQVRLNGIDCPELDQPFGRRAKQFTSNLVFGKEVSVEELGRDSYGRTIGEVTLDGKSLNLELVRAGYAWWYREDAPRDRILKRLESEARDVSRGLWVDPSPIPPWEFRKMKKQGALGHDRF